MKASITDAVQEIIEALPNGEDNGRHTEDLYTELYMKIHNVRIAWFVLKDYNEEYITCTGKFESPKEGGRYRSSWPLCRA